ncbi:MAG TPA: hypothetical protein VFI97_04600 [Arthrobacter sp.]|nr:hypothetical protein [Arthrobacter sp.]
MSGPHDNDAGASAAVGLARGVFRAECDAPAWPLEGGADDGGGPSEEEVGDTPGNSWEPSGTAPHAVVISTSETANETRPARAPARFQNTLLMLLD